MLRLSVVLATIALIATPATPVAGCPFCSGDVRSRMTLRMQYAQAKVVVLGQLKNPRFNPKTDEGSTDLAIDVVLKDDPARKGQGVIISPEQQVRKQPVSLCSWAAQGIAKPAQDKTFWRRS